jgi:hypothetical protein
LLLQLGLFDQPQLGIAGSLFADPLGEEILLVFFENLRNSIFHLRGHFCCTPFVLGSGGVNLGCDPGE